MANVVINDTHLTDIAKAIRSKNGKTTTYKPSEMASAISAISTGSSSSKYGSVQVSQLPLTYKAIGASSFTNWKNQMTNNNIPTSLDLTTYGIKSDWSNFGGLIFSFGFYSYNNASNTYGSGFLYKENGVLKLKAHLTPSAQWYESASNSSNISFTPWTDTTKANAAVWEINPSSFPANNVSFASKYNRSSVSTYDLGDCIAFYSGEVIKLV